MAAHEIAPGDNVDARRGDVVVVIPLYGAHLLFTRCLRSVLDHTPADVPILVADDASPDPASRSFVDEVRDAMPDRRIVWLRQPANLGFVGNCNVAFASTAPADVVLLNSDCEVAEGWLEGLHAAANSDSMVATATALTNHGTIVSVPYRNIPVPHLPQDITLADAAARVRARSARFWPRIPTAVGHCVYIRRSALDLVGGFDPAFAPAYGEEVDFSQRCIAAGLQHVVADDVFVLHHGGASLSVDGERNPIADEHEEIIASRYPWYEDAVELAESDVAGPLARSLALARQALLGTTVTIDGRCLTPHVTGTQVHTLALIAALHRSGKVRIRVITPHDLGQYARDQLAEMADVELHPLEAVSELTPRDDVVHRPYQVSSLADLDVLRQCGERVVVTQLDLIGYRNPSYFNSRRAFHAYQRLTRATLALADQVVFISEHARDDAMRDDLVDAGRARVIGIGVGDEMTSAPEAEEPSCATSLAGQPFLVCLGTDFRHKNRMFALKLLKALRARGWNGVLVSAGPHVAEGSSGGEEAQWLALNPETAAAVIEVAAVSDGQRQWLYEHATAVVYPTTYEGFGIVPFEAATAGTPCLWAPQASLTEVLPVDAAVLQPWDADLSAERALPVLTDAAEAQRLVGVVRDAAARFTWDGIADATLKAYDDAVRSPARYTSRLAADALASEDERGEWEGRYWHLHETIGGTGMALVGPEPLLPDPAQRALAGLARRPATRTPLLAMLRVAQRAVVRPARNGGPKPDAEA